MSEKEAKETKETKETQQTQQKEEVVKITPFARMVTNYYEVMAWIQPEEKEEFAKSLCGKSSNAIVNTINNFVQALTGNLIGALFAPLLVKISMRAAQRLDYANEIDEMKAEAKKQMAAEILGSL